SRHYKGMPQTAFDLPPQYDPHDVERRLYQRWLDRGVFTARVDSSHEPYVIVMPPPNITAILHTGQGLNNVIQDVLIRFERMRGREALWLPGTDQAGTLYYIRYPVEGGPAPFLTVATTRPETMLGDTAVAVNPKDKRHKGFIGKTARLPIAGLPIPIIGDDAVDPAFGTGFVKVT